MPVLNWRESVDAYWSPWQVLMVTLHSGWSRTRPW